MAGALALVDCAVRPSPTIIDKRKVPRIDIVAHFTALLVKLDIWDALSVCYNSRKNGTTIWRNLWQP